MSEPSPVADAALVGRMLDEMAALQAHHNREVAEDWRQRGFPYYRAVWVECAELLDHFGWKWWKKQVPDAEQVKLELIDIWHFGLSMLLRDEVALADVAAQLHGAVGADRPPERLRTDVEALALAALRDHAFSVAAFVDCMNAMGMSVADLYEAYIGKNVLNNFRQHHGYADGSYRKLWSGREDNEHLLEVLDGLDPAADDFQQQLYAALSERYLASG